jgi:hypothetical protein
MSDLLNGLQAILGTDKKNPMFAVYRDAQKRELHVYYGFELLEVVPDDKTSPRFKLMVAQLYNAGVKGLTLIEVFCVDPKSMRKWGRALRSGDPETLVKALQGRGGRKLTPEIKAFIKRRFPILYAENPRNYSSRMRQEIFEIFNVQLSGEGLRPFFHELKAKRQAQLDGNDGNDGNHPSDAQEAEESGDPEQILTSSESSEVDDPPGSIPSEQSAPHGTDGTGEAEQPSAKKGALAV